MNNIFNDASVYEIHPSEVVTPKDSVDLVNHLKECFVQHKKITMRAGGTSLGGQAIGSGTVIDVSKHLTNILQYDPELKEVTVEPGVIQDDLNDFVKADALRFAPDTSTSNRAMIGGMIGNNSCGSYSVYYGTTREHVKSLDVVLADGSETTFGPLNDEQLQAKLKQQDFEGNIYRTVFNILDRHGKQILEQYPHSSIKRRNTGYAIDELYRHHQPFNPHGESFNLAPLICGSEGTLAVTKSAILNLVELPKYRQLICAHFDSIELAMKSIIHLLEFEPAAIELIDKATLDGTKNNLQQQENRFWIEDDPHAVLVCEWFAEDEAELNHQMLTVQTWLKNNYCYAAPIIPTQMAHKVWEVRKAGLGMLMGKITRKKAVAVIEDAAVPVYRLFDYFQDVQALMAELKVDCVYYGHASVGLIHIRPELDLSTEQGKALFRKIAQSNSTLVKKYRGALSGEHGDGRIRAPFLKEQLGEQVYAYLLEIKRAFDPHNLLNPGVVLGNAGITENLRANRQPLQLLKTGFDWSNDISLIDAVEKCNGAAACRKSAGRGVMCPSYQATREESYSTRGRSNLLRFALTEVEPRKALSKHELQDALEMCLSCKACKSECPASVDMARLKSEILFQTKQQGVSVSLSDWLLKHYGAILKQGQKYPQTYNWLQSLSLFKKMVGVDSRRSLPMASSFDLESWWNNDVVQKSDASQSLKVWVLCDLFSQYQESEVGQAVLKTLNCCDVTVEPVFMQQSPRALISRGLLKEAKQALVQVIMQLENYRSTDLIVGIEPSELLVWRDEAAALLKDATLQNTEVWLENNQSESNQGLKSILSYEELLLKLKSSDLMPELNRMEKCCWLHVHCHQKSLAKPLDTKHALELIPGLDVKMISSGCCGMSGEFGYKHYDVSKKIAAQTLLPALGQAKDDDLIVATGTSCRHQVKDLEERHALHVAQVVASAIGL